MNAYEDSGGSTGGSGEVRAAGVPMAVGLVWNSEPGIESVVATLTPPDRRVSLGA